MLTSTEAVLKGLVVPTTGRPHVESSRNRPEFVLGSDRRVADVSRHIRLATTSLANVATLVPVSDADRFRAERFHGL